jgi:hypothetical protein
MSWTIPDKGEGDNDIQSILFQEYLDVLVAGLAGIDCVLSGLVVTGGADMTPAVAKGAVLSNKIMYAVAAADVTITAADATNPRIDLIVVTSAGALAVRAGTPAASPKPPARTANDVVIAAVYVPANDTSIETTKCIDMRVFPSMPQIVARTSTPVTINTNNTIQTYFTVTVPSGLLATGRMIRVQCGGYFLLNSGTPIITLTISYGGTTMFADAAIIGAVDADEGAWFLEFTLSAQSLTTQWLTGQISLEPTIAQRVAPTSGIAGNMAQVSTAANQNHIAPFLGTASVDSDAANRDILVRWTMDVSNAADEISMKFATAELI